jgi:CelD/BcsL family acetyltransferase involved in cellulose biosynthesis
MRTLFRSLSRELLDVDVLRLSILERNGRPIAATIGFLHRDRYLLYNSGYDPTESVGSPGIVAVAYAMRDAIAQKAVLFDFLSGSEPYKYQVGAQNTYTCRIRVAR